MRYIAAVLTLLGTLSILPNVAGSQALEELWSTTGPPEAPFGILGSVVQAPDGTIIISDTGAPTLYRFSPESGFLNTFEGRGQGPGELDTPTLLTVTESGRIALYDVGRRAVFLYDSSLEPVQDIRMREQITNPKGFAFLNDGTFVLGGGRVLGLMGIGTVFMVHHFDGDGNLLDSYVPQAQTDDQRAAVHTAGGPLIALAGGGFLYSNSAPHRILRFDREMNFSLFAEDAGIVNPILDRFTTEYIRPEDGRKVNSYDWYYDQSTGVFELADRRVLNLITRRHTSDSVWEIWSSTGELVHRFVEPRPYRALAITQDGTVLAIFEDAETAEDTLVGLRLRAEYQ